jgi:phosphoglycerate dehydrogenase-like enzyme
MSKHESRSSSTFGIASEIRSREHSGGSKSAATRSGLGEIGFVGVGRMGAAMAANLAAEGLQVIAYVRRPDQIGKLEALGLVPTTDIGDLFHCDVVISIATG